MQEILDKNTIEVKKIELTQTGLQRLQKAHQKLRQETENHGNHFAMVENFVEKYIPIQI